MMKSWRLAFVFLLTYLLENRGSGIEASALGARCLTPLRQMGTCVSLQQCPEVLLLYQKLHVQRATEYSQTLRTICNNEVTYDNYPLVCCAAPKLPFPNQPGNEEPPVLSTERIFTTSTSTTPSTTPTPERPTERSENTQTQTRVGNSCRTGIDRWGQCKHLRDCESVLNLVLNNPDNEEIKQMVRDSNKLCNSVQHEVCCPDIQRRTLEVVKIPTEDDGCGRASQKSLKIYGGEEAAIGSWPWMALLGYDKYSFNPFRCGGSLISKKHVITAAHCTKPHEPTFIRLGEHDLSTDNETVHIDIDIERFISHPDFGPDRRFDIAVIFLTELVQFTELIAPICLPMAQELRTRSYVNNNPFVAGWGRTEGGSSSHVLLQTQLPIHNNSICQNVYARLNRLVSPQQFDNSVICAGVLSGGIDTCQGDSGGPLMIPEAYKGTLRYYLLGIVSYGIRCAEPGKPGVYTNVQYFIDWILEKIAS